jgi:glycosyltransferase involved in cell wall biosynthesis
MNTPLVSVIIPNYNYANYLRQAIDSVLLQTYSNIEIIVVDDGSKDASKEILKSYGDKISVIFQQNSGVSAARNNGFAASKGEFIAFLDADDFWIPEKIAKQIDLFQSNPNLGFVHVGVQYVDAQNEPIKDLTDGQEGWVSEEFLLLDRPVVMSGGSGMMMPRRVLEKIGGFDPELSTCADWDLFYRISCIYEFGFLPEILLKYRIHDSNMHGNIQRMEREMLHGYQKAFSKESSKLQKIKRTAYGNLHKVLAGSYFYAQEYGNFLKHSLISVWLKPSNFIYFGGFPLRLIRRNGKLK